MKPVIDAMFALVLGLLVGTTAAYVSTHGGWLTVIPGLFK